MTCASLLSLFYAQTLKSGLLILCQDIRNLKKGLGKLGLVVVVVVPSDPSFARIFSDVLPNGNRVFMCISYTGRAVSCIWRRGLFLLTFCALNDTLHDIHTSGMSNASVHTLHMPKPNVTRVQSATQWTASVHTLHMSKPNVTRVQSATQWTASVHTLHMSKPVM